MGRGAASNLSLCGRTDLFEVRPFLRAVALFAIRQFDFRLQVRLPSMRGVSPDSAKGRSWAQTVVAR
jgi:hypothetical protein